MLGHLHQPVDDPSNCGSCGNVCSGNCKNGSCVCTLPEVSCSGVCVKILSDPKNCGSCGNVCPILPLCVLGVCITQLDGGY